MKIGDTILIKPQKIIMTNDTQVIIQYPGAPSFSAIPKDQVQEVIPERFKVGDEVHYKNDKIYSVSPGSKGVILAIHETVAWVKFKNHSSLMEISFLEKVS